MFFSLDQCPYFPGSISPILSIQSDSHNPGKLFAPEIFTKHNSFQASFGINDSAVFLKEMI